jgi:NAD(P)H-hydrate epimerase
MEAAALGMFVHGRAGDLALADQSVESLLATDLLRYIGGAFESLSNEK